jgi:RNA polymerase-binding transcription factor DksA
MGLEHARRRLTEERDRLLGLRDEARSALQDERQTGSSELSTLDQHGADVATELHDREVGESILEGLQAELGEVEQAFGRLEAGTYGRCEADVEPIPDERLEAVPATRFCARHQARQEALG